MSSLNKPVIVALICLVAIGALIIEECKCKIGGLGPEQPMNEEVKDLVKCVST